MNIASNRVSENAREAGSKTNPVFPSYIESTKLIERLHRALLDVVKDDFERAGMTDVNAIQALLLYNIGGKEMTAGELRSRGHYLGSNVSYNLKKLVEAGYLHHERSETDKRSVRVRLTDKGKAIHEQIKALYEHHSKSIEAVGGLGPDEFTHLNEALHKLERFWGDQIRYRL
jgi:DNA-binding MarR family transcriptional regulator